jgi:tetratricopeptide (TPR) repeat protein
MNVRPGSLPLRAPARLRRFLAARRLARPLAGATVVLVLLVGPTVGADVNKLRTEVTDLEQQSRNLNVRYQTQVGGAEQIAEHRLVDAQVLYNLRDYTRAAILLLDYVTKYKSTRGYPEAVFYLADSLYQRRDFLSAKRYFQLIVREVRGKYYQEALQRLVELSLRTGDQTDVNEYLTALASIPQHMLQPSVPYVRGKYYYFKDQFDASLSAFRSVGNDNKYYMHSQYFIGAVQVQRKEYAPAVQTFQALLRVNPKSDGDKHIRDLTYLALGRLLYEENKIDAAIDMYQKVSRRSEEFDTSLYEICWAYIKATQYRKALRALDLLVLAHPESAFIPQVKVLQGNLLIRLQDWGRATDLFTKTREKFVPVHTRMKQIMAEHSDPNVFFDVLLARNEGKLGVVVQVPPLAVMWVKEDAKVKRALNLVRDVRDIQDSIKEAQDLIKRLERAINTPAKIKIFPEFASAKASSLEVENRLLLARKQILKDETDLVAAVATGSEKDQLRTLTAKRAGFEQKVKDLPTTAAGYTSREKERLNKITSLEQEVTRQSIIVDSLRAQLVAAEKFFQDTQGAKNKQVRDDFIKEIDGVRKMIAELSAEVDEVRQALADAKTATGVGGAEEVAERGVKTQYRQALAEEHKLLAGLRSRLGGSQGSEFDALAGLLARCDSVDTTIDTFDKKLDRGVEEKLSSIRTTLKEEKEAVSKYTTETAEYKKETDTVAGAITYEGFQHVAGRFYEIVVRADVGIIDVAWALKDAKSKEVSRLVRQQKMDLKVLDDEFKEVLQEDQ